MARLTIRSNVRAICLITTLDASYGWATATGGDWIYSPTASIVPTLGAHFDRNIHSCVEHDRRNILKTLLFNPDHSKNVTNVGVKDALEELTWPADNSDSRGTTSFISRFPPESQYIAGSDWASGYHLGDGIVGTAGHCLLDRFLENKIHPLKVVFGWSDDVRGKRFAANQVFEIERWVRVFKDLWERLLKCVTCQSDAL